MIHNSNKSIIKKPYCKVCHDAGKHESEYTNHWVKDLNGKTICPTLLNTECRYCFKRGHTAKFCSKIKNKENEQTIKIQNKTKTNQNKPTNGFAVLYNDDDVDDDKEEATNEIPIEKSWASIASKPKIQKEQKVLLKISKPIQPKSWADWSDSEEEEEEEEEKEEEVGYDTW
jgi:hypothetical protein